MRQSVSDAAPRETPARRPSSFKHSRPCAVMCVGCALSCASFPARALPADVFCAVEEGEARAHTAAAAAAVPTNVATALAAATTAMASRRPLRRGSGSSSNTSSSPAPSVHTLAEVPTPASAVETLDGILRQHGPLDSVRVPVRFLEHLRARFEELQQQCNRDREDDAEDDDAILDDTIQDFDVRSTLRQTFSSRTPGADGTEESPSSTKVRQRRRTSAESLHLVRQVLKQQRLSTKQHDVDEFVALLWHLCQRAHVVGPDMTDDLRARISAAYLGIGAWGVDVRNIRRIFGGVPGSELVFVVLSGIHKLKLGAFLVGFQGTDAMWNMFALLGNYVWSIADGYMDNPYHNVAHAADVTQTCLSFLAPETGGLAAVLSPEQQVALLLAACMHDVGHVGVSNNLLVATEHPLALRYHDVSPLEQLHCATGFETLQEPGCNFLGVFRKHRAAEYAKMRQLIIQLVLGTDMRHHFKHVAALKKVVERAATPKPSRSTTPTPTPDGGSGGGGGGGGAGAPGSGGGDVSGTNMSSVSWEQIAKNEEDLLLLLKECIHAADISNPAKPWPVCKFWTDCVLEEFFAQGDRERARGLPISHGMDRLNPIPLPKFQMGFIQALVLPLYELLSNIREVDLSAPLACLRANLVEWQRIQDAPVQAARKSVSRSPSLRRAALEADEERHIRDLASHALSKIHLSHAKHAASRHLRLRRSSTWTKGRAGTGAGLDDGSAAVALASDGCGSGRSGGAEAGGLAAGKASSSSGTTVGSASADAGNASTSSTRVPLGTASRAKSIVAEGAVAAAAANARRLSMSPARAARAGTRGRVRSGGSTSSFGSVASAPPLSLDDAAVSASRAGSTRGGLRSGSGTPARVRRSRTSGGRSSPMQFALTRTKQRLEAFPSSTGDESGD